LSEDRIRTEIRRYVIETWLSGDDRGFDDDTDLQQSGVLDSFSTLALTAHLDKAFDIRIEPAEVNPTNFKSIATLAKLVLDKRGQASVD